MTHSDANGLLASLYPERSAHYFGRFAIGDSQQSMNEGAALILGGVKTATSSLFTDFPDGRIPFTGALSVLEDGQGRGVAVVETREVQVIPFERISAEFAFEYGEGDRTLDWFSTRMRRWYEAHDPGFTEATPVICEWIRVLRRLD